MSPGHARRILCNGVVHASYAPADRSGHNPPSLPIPGLCKGMPVDGSRTWRMGLLTRVGLGLFLPECRHPSLHYPLAGHSCLLRHHLADHLARKGISVKRLPLRLKIEPVGEGHQNISTCGSFPSHYSLAHGT